MPLEPLTHSQLCASAAAQRLDVRLLQTIMLTESSGSGFLPDGRCKILYERHIMWARLQTPDRDINPVPFATAHPDLCGVEWNPSAYPYGTEAHQYDRLATVTAYAQNHDPAQVLSYQKAAYESCSWGVFQLLGEHYAAAGYADILPFVSAMQHDEQHQLDAVLQWMDGNGLLAILRAKDWDGFARGYNGDGQVAVYSARLQANYAKATG